MRRKAARDRRPARGPMCAGRRDGRVAACRVARGCVPGGYPILEWGASKGPPYPRTVAEPLLLFHAEVGEGLVGLGHRVGVLAAVVQLLGLVRSEEHTSELQSHHDLVCRL